MNLATLLLRPKQLQDDENTNSSLNPKNENEISHNLDAKCKNPHYSQLGQRPPVHARRLTIHDACYRPALLTKQTSFKSSSALPTLNTLAATSSTTPTTPSALATLSTSYPNTLLRRASSLDHRPFTMASRDFSATDMLKQAIGATCRVSDDETEVYSTSNTPPGARTPKPDLSDKRLPGINSGYFSQQTTPPQTPRKRSQEANNPSGNNSSTNGVDIPPPAQPAPPAQTSSPSESLLDSAPSIGELKITISEGRGLPPTLDPFVVCGFQSAQFISEGPQTNNSTESSDLQARNIGPVDKRKPMAIPMRSRQSSSNGRAQKAQGEITADPRWNQEVIFDVVGEHTEIDVSVYSKADNEAFLGHVRFSHPLSTYTQPFDGWFPLQPRDETDETTGEVYLQIKFKKVQKIYGPQDFDILKLIGKGTFGQVFQVREKVNPAYQNAQKKVRNQVYAMKVLSKKVIIQKKEVAHTLGERNILVRTARTDSPFIIGLKFSFQTPTDLYLVTDYMAGGELFWHLQKEGRFSESRAKFYVAELILALKHLHEHNIVYRDLKPENILLDANGHIALCDFGLSKANLKGSDTTNTFCGTTEYLAPEVLLDESGYTKMVDFWSLGVLVFEMCCGWSPFYAEDTQQMYKNIAFGKIKFPRDALSVEGRNFVKGLLNRNPCHRLGYTRDALELMEHPFFEDVDWVGMADKQTVPPFKPQIKDVNDTSNFDPEFTNALAHSGSLNARAAALASGVNTASTPISPTVQANFKGFTYVNDSALDTHFKDRANGAVFTNDNGDIDIDDDSWEQVDQSHRMSRVMTHDDEGIFGHQFVD